MGERHAWLATELKCILYLVFERQFEINQTVVVFERNVVAFAEFGGEVLQRGKQTARIQFTT